MVGVSTALHLQKRGQSVVLVDRRGAGEETSYGNTGIIQREGVVPYPFPRQIGRMAQYALNMRTEANLHWSALPQIAPWLYRYWQASTPAGLAATAQGARPLIERCVSEHEALMVDAGILGMMRRTGYLRFYRSARCWRRRSPRTRPGARPTGSSSRWSTPASWPSWSRT
jgi:D-amino-acid dehydrogenase